MARASTARTLVLYARYTDRLSYYDDWLDAFDESPLFDVSACNIVTRSARGDIAEALQSAELVVLLHSTNGDTTIYLEPLLSMLASRRCPAVAFIGNEVNLPGSPVAAKRAAMQAMGVDYVASQLLPEAGDHLWGDVAGRGVLALPHALNPTAFAPGPPLADRTMDIGVRAVRYVPHLGDCDRNALHDLFAEHAFAPDLTVDVGAGRLDRGGWAAFLRNCRGTVSSEAGSWWLEQDDRTVEAIREWTAVRDGGRRLVIANDSPLRRLGHKLPWQFKAALRRILSSGPLRHESTVTEDLPFEEVYERFFAGRKPPCFYGKCISSRHFDAAGTGTVQILLKGRYNDILEPGVHYLSLEPDYSNLDEVLAQFRDPAVGQRIADASRDLVMQGHTYGHRLAALHARLA